MRKHLKITKLIQAQSQPDAYQAIFQLDVNDPKIIEKAFRSINNVIKDPRLEGKIRIELIAFADGTEVYMKGGNMKKI
jgi:hypothetical protein